MRAERDKAINKRTLKNAFTIDAQHGVDVLLIATIAHKIGAINYILLFNDLEAGKVHLHKRPERGNYSGLSAWHRLAC